MVPGWAAPAGWEQGGLIAIADAGVGTAAALLVGWRCLCGGKEE